MIQCSSMASALPVEVLEILAISIGDLKDVMALAGTSQRFRSIILSSDRIWQKRLLTDISVWSDKISPKALERLVLDSNDYDSHCRLFQVYQRLYKHKWAKPSIWFGDRNQFGSVMSSIFNYDQGVFEFYECICDKDREIPQDWTFSRFSANDNVEIHEYAPKINMVGPILIIDPLTIDYSRPETLADLNCRSEEFDRDNPRLAIGLLRVRPMLPSRIHPSMMLWPPRTIPAETRARNSSATEFRGQLVPREPCDSIIRVVKTIAYPNPVRNIPSSQLASGSGSLPSSSSSSSAAAAAAAAFSTGALASVLSPTRQPVRSADFMVGFGVWSAPNRMVGEARKVETYSRWPEKVRLTSNLSKDDHSNINSPDLQGLWVGDIGGRLGELLMLHQPSPNRLEAVKLTADVRVPRGEVEFAADLNNISTTRYPEWPRANVVLASWQTSGVDHLNPKYLPCEVILISNNKIALYCPEEEHLVYLMRLQVDLSNGVVGTA